MKLNPTPVHVTTEDSLKLMGMHYRAEKETDTCILMIHGMAGNYIDNTFGQVLGQHAVNAGYDYIYTHNRGWGIVNDVTTTIPNNAGGYKFKRYGAVYEEFFDSQKDIQAWKEYALVTGYKKLILVGHSFGSPKLIYYLSRVGTENVTGLALASPADMVGLTVRDEGEDYENMVQEAKDLIANNQPRAILSQQLADWVALSAKTYLDEGVNGAPADVLPILRNPDTWPELARINVPILAILTEHDSVIIRSIKEDLQLIESKATNCPEFTGINIDGTDHVYADKEEEFSQKVIDWVNKIASN